MLLPIQIPTRDTRMFRNCDIAGCEIQTGDMGTPPSRASKISQNQSKIEQDYALQSFTLLPLLKG